MIFGRYDSCGKFASSYSKKHELRKAFCWICYPSARQPTKSCNIVYLNASVHMCSFKTDNGVFQQPTDLTLCLKKRIYS